MTEPLHLPRVYGEKEIGQILKRATDLQHEEPSAPSAAGVTLAELEDIAAEAGIDPVFLRRAAMEVDSGVADPSFWVHITGEELMLVRDVTLPGELPDDGFERIVTAIQSRSREHGQPTNPGREPKYADRTGRDADVIEFIGRRPEAATFWDHVRGLVDAQIRTYLDRGFTSLSVRFGCTGGQHRSVYFAERLARHLAVTYPGLNVRLEHRESGSWPGADEASSTQGPNR